MPRDNIGDIALLILGMSIDYDSPVTKECRYVRADMMKHLSYIVQILDEFKANKNKALLKWTYLSSKTENFVNLTILHNAKNFGMNLEKFEDYKFGDELVPKF